MEFNTSLDEVRLVDICLDTWNEIYDETIQLNPIRFIYGL